jgi:hypothetical protein
LRYVDASKQKEILDAYTAWKYKINYKFILYIKKFILRKINKMNKNNILKYYLL